MSETQETFGADDVALAGEYVLRLLDAAQAAAFEARLAAEPALRQLVSEWQERFSALDDEAAEAPPAALWPRIESAAFGPPEARTAPWLPGWLAGALAAAAIAIAAAFVLLPTTSVAPTHSAAISAEDGSLVVQARLGANGELFLSRESGAARPGRALELWLIAEGAEAPVSLGVLPEQAEARFIVPEDMRPAFTGATLAISDEPPGGSPTGAPTGDVLAAAPVQQL